MDGAAKSVFMQERSHFSCWLCFAVNSTSCVIKVPVILCFNCLANRCLIPSPFKKKWRQSVIFYMQSISCISAIGFKSWNREFSILRTRGLFAVLQVRKIIIQKTVASLQPIRGSLQSDNNTKGFGLSTLHIKWSEKSQAPLASCTRIPGSEWSPNTFLPTAKRIEATRSIGISIYLT